VLISKQTAFVEGLITRSKGDTIVDYRNGDAAVISGIKDALEKAGVSEVCSPQYNLSSLPPEVLSSSRGSDFSQESLNFNLTGFLRLSLLSLLTVNTGFAR
jgi:hypothetical protein